MAQSMVNIRMDSDVKKRMEQACTDMGLSTTMDLYVHVTGDEMHKEIKKLDEINFKMA